ncbi:MAG: peptidase S8, partial [Pseudonocardiaceae bacterium]
MIVALTLTVTASIVSGGPASGQPAMSQLAVGLPPAAGLPPGPLRGKISPLLDGTKGPVTLFVELVQTSAVDIFQAERGVGRTPAAAAVAARTAKSQIGQAADRVLGRLQQRGASVHELFRTANAVPGLAVIADAQVAQVLGELAGSPDVRSVRTIIPKTTMNSSAVQ